MKNRKLRNILLVLLVMVIALSAIAVYSGAAASDITTYVSENFANSTLGTIKTASNASSYHTLGNARFVMTKTKYGKVEVCGTPEDKYALITHEDWHANSAPYVYMDAGKQATVSSDKTSFTKSGQDLSNYKYLIYEVDIMSPTGKFPDLAYIGLEADYVNTSGAKDATWSSETASIVQIRNGSDGSTYIQQSSKSTVKKYLNPYKFTRIQIIVENVTADDTIRYDVKLHVYIDGEFFFSKEVADEKTTYLNGIPNAVFNHPRFYTGSAVKKEDLSLSIAMDNLAWKTVPRNSSTTIDDVVYKPTEVAQTIEYVSGGNTVRANMSLANAFALADSGTTIKLLSDCEQKGDKIVVSKDITLDLNGYTLNGLINRARRDAGLIDISAGKTFNLISSRPGAKIFSGAISGTADPVLVPREGTTINVIGCDEDGNTTISFYGATFIRDYNVNPKVNITGGEYYRTRNSDVGIIQLEKNFSLTVKDAFFYHNGTEASDGVFTFRGRFNIGGTTKSTATIDNCVIITNTNVVSHTNVNATTVFTNCFISGDINPAVYDGQTAGVVTLGEGCAVDGTFASVVLADGLVEENVTNILKVTTKCNTFKETNGKLDASSLDIAENNIETTYNRFITEPGKKISIVWRDNKGVEMARTEGIRGEKITYTPYQAFVDNGRLVEYIEGWVSAVPDEWCEPLEIPADFEGEEYILTFKENGKSIPYEGIFPVLFNIAAEVDTKVNIYIPKPVSGIEYTTVYLDDKVVYGYDENGNFVNWENEVTLKGVTYYVITERIGVVRGAKDEVGVKVNYTCAGNNLSSSFSTDMARYCNTVLEGAGYSKASKDLVVNIANYLVSCLDLIGGEYTDVTDELAKIVDENSERIIAPSEESLVLPEVGGIGKYVYSVHVTINDEGPSFVFTLTEDGKKSGVELSTSVGNSVDEPYSEVGYIRTGNDKLTNVNRTTITVIPTDDAPQSMVYSMANYCKALEGTEGEEVSLALYGFIRSQMVYKNIEDISIEKTSSHGKAITANVGDEIEYTIKVTNYDDVTKALTLTDGVPENTTYVSGAESFADNKLSWNVVLARGESATFTYKVKIDEDVSLYEGGYVESSEACAANMTAKASPVYIERTFNEADQKYIDIALDALKASKFEGLTLAKWIYYVAYSNFSSFTHATDIIANLTAFMDGTASVYQFDKVAPTLYGGKKVDGTIPAIKGAPTSYVSEDDLIVGDLILVEEDGVGKCYLYASDGLYLLDVGAERVDTDSVLFGLTSTDMYVVVRTSARFVNFTPTDMNKEPDALTDIQKVIVDTAKYYLQRGEWLQYDDTYFAYSNTAIGNESRWEAGLTEVEQRTSQDIGYINCAAFTHDVYWTVFGQALPRGMYTTNSLTTYSGNYNMKMYSYTRNTSDTHTDEEKAKVEREFKEALQPGDIMVILRGSSGHAMLYIGDGLFIHSSGSSYDAGNGAETYDATIRYHRVNDYFFNPASENGYIFNKITSLCIVRPLNNTSWANYEVTENAQNRVDNLMGITAQKLPSVGKNVSVNPGDEITYTFSIRNDNKFDKTLDITDKLSSYVQYVGGADRIDGNNVYFTVTVPADSTVEVSYTVKVLDNVAYGTVIESKSAKVGGVIHPSYSTTVRRTLTEAEQAALIEAYNELVAEGTALRGLELANELYKMVLGVEKAFDATTLEGVTDGEGGLFTPEGLGTLGNGKQAYQIDKESVYYDLLAGGLYGGRAIASKPNENIRTELAKEEYLVVGDILIGRSSSERVIYIYLGGESFINLSTFKTDSYTVDGRLERMPSYVYHYVVFRASYAAE